MSVVKSNEYAVSVLPDKVESLVRKQILKVKKSGKKREEDFFKMLEKKLTEHFKFLSEVQEKFDA